jgi:colanic acid biosynthesis protein WcaH
MSSAPSKAINTVSFMAGFAVSSFLRYLDKKRISGRNRQNAGAFPEGNDSSMFWGDVNELTKVPQKNKFLPAELYGQMIRDTIGCCVDALVVRFNPLTNRKECLLVERATEPVKGVWWLPGGRLFKGETFFDGAIRKAKEETGLDNVKPIQVLGFYNTFFPTSAWDTIECQGTQTVQPIVLVEVERAAEVMLDKTSERYRWIGLDPEQATKDGEDKYVIDALLKLQAWNSTYGEKK